MYFARWRLYFCTGMRMAGEAKDKSGEDGRKKKNIS
jgi:hypothetical protein